jgi:hypothetical protein
MILLTRERQWVRCCSEYHSVFQGRSEKEILLASSELRRRRRICAGGKGATARKLADFLQSIESEEALLDQRMRDREAQSARHTRLASSDSGGQEQQAPPTVQADPCPATPTSYVLYGEFRMTAAGFPAELLTRSCEERLQYFWSYTLAHPLLVEAKDRLMAAISESEPNSLVFVFGPTGVGKTTLKIKVEQVITNDLRLGLEQDRGRIHRPHCVHSTCPAWHHAGDHVRQLPGDSLRHRGATSKAPASK